MTGIKIVFLVLLVGAVLANEKGPEVTLDQGSLLGKYRQTLNGRTISAFTGIPYAEPPVGELRFKRPVPAGPWEGVLDATQPHAVCPQINVYINDLNIQGDENCLYLNVYTPQLPNADQELLPVMFYIHGGGWMCGSANDNHYGPDILLDHDVILVTINYRLGVLGFLSTGDTVSPGNNGLKDQNLALKWVKRNIASFGGDPDKITVFGQSAGGASAHFHALSSLSRDLVKGIIPMSGTAFEPWAFGSKEYAVANAKKLADWLDCPTTSSLEMVDCFMKVPAYKFIEQDTKFLLWSYDPMIPFRPVLEPDHEGAFLTEEPIDTIKAGKAADIPMLTGFTSEDGAFKSSRIYNDTELVPALDKGFNKIAPAALVYHDSPSNHDDISKRVRKFYFGDRRIDESTRHEVTAMFTDAWFLVGEDAAVRAHLKYSKQPVYYYLFAYRGTQTFANLCGDQSYDYGVSHCDELIYLVSNRLYKGYEPNESEKKMNLVMSTLWTNFAKTGDPTPETDSVIPAKWAPVKTKRLEYFTIKSGTDMRMEQDLYDARAKFWRKISFASRWIKFRDEL